MPETGAKVQMPRLAEYVVRGIEYFTWPRPLDDYLELISPLWSTKELRGRIERVHRETDDAVTVFITPGFRWRGHAAGQYLRIGFDVDGKRQWRAYSLSSDASRPDGQVTITVKKTTDGVVSQWLHGTQAPGSIVTLGDVEGEFHLPPQVPDKLLFLTAGSGITPVMAMLRGLGRRGALPDTVHVHSARTPESAIFASELAALAERDERYRLTQRVTGTEGRLTPVDLDTICPDWRHRQVYACGPGEMLDTLSEYFSTEGVSEQLHIESFEHMLLGDVEAAGGTISFSRSGVDAVCDGSTPILVAGEDSGVSLPFGCRMGICHTCTAKLVEGAVRDLRTGEVTMAGTEIRTCVNCPDGAVTINL
jgi:ferredoxin-NADP reductase